MPTIIRVKLLIDDVLCFQLHDHDQFIGMYLPPRASPGGDTDSYTLCLHAIKVKSWTITTAITHNNHPAI